MADEHKLKRWRLARGLTITECADGAKIHRRQWRALEEGGGAHFATVDAVVVFCRKVEVGRGEKNPGNRIRYESFRTRIKAA